jgi:hypothetical protein
VGSRGWATIVAATVGLATALSALLAPHHGRGASLRPVAEAGGEHEATRLIGRASCGVERWPVKTLTDPDARKINFAAVHKAKVGTLGALPTNPGGQSSRGPLETRVYAATARLVRVKPESDSDYHLVLTSGGRSLIAEMPFVGCDAGGRHRAQMTGARRALDAALGRPVGNRWRYTRLRVRVVGVLFFDFPHGQAGHARNYAELHPVVGFRVLC